MDKRKNILKGFDNLLASTENIEAANISLGINDTSKHLEVDTSESNNGQKYKRLKKAKSKELKKCTLYLPEEVMDSLAIMKVRTKRDLSELAAEALETYLEQNKNLYI